MSWTNPNWSGLPRSIRTDFDFKFNFKNRVFGHYAQILVDVNLSAKLHNKILVERDEFAFYVGVEYERLPSFCSYCQVIGHSSQDCKKRPEN